RRRVRRGPGAAVAPAQLRDRAHAVRRGGRARPRAPVPRIATGVRRVAAPEADPDARRDRARFAARGDGRRAGRPTALGAELHPRPGVGAPVARLYRAQTRRRLGSAGWGRGWEGSSRSSRSWRWLETAP